MSAAAQTTITQNTGNGSPSMNRCLHRNTFSLPPELAHLLEHGSVHSTISSLFAACQGGTIPRMLDYTDLECHSFHNCFGRYTLTHFKFDNPPCSVSLTGTPYITWTPSTFDHNGNVTPPPTHKPNTSAEPHHRNAHGSKKRSHTSVRRSTVTIHHTTAHSH
jgi:hypothetical protein